MQHQVIKLDSKGNLSDCGDFGSPVFEDTDGLQRAMDLRNYLGDDYVVFTETHKGYRVFRNRPNHYGLVLTANDGLDSQHYIAYSYHGSGHDSNYLGSKSYGTYKGACKKVYQYLH